MSKALEAAGPAPRSIEEVDGWMSRYMETVELARAEAIRIERLNEAAPDLLAALQGSLNVLQAVGAKDEANAALAAISKALGNS